MHRWFPRFAFGLALASLLLAPSWSVRAAGTPARGRKLILISTTDVKGKTSPCGCHTPKGGIARLASVADSLRSLYPDVLLLDAGGFFPEDDVHQPQSAFLMGSYKLLGTDAVGIGERELRFGLGYLRAQQKRTGIPLVSANLYDRFTKKPAFPPYVIKDMGGAKVGIFALMTDKNDLGPARDSLYIVEPSNTAAMTIAEMKKKGATVIVLLSQLGKTESEDLVTAVDGIDAVIVGRNVPLLEVGRKVKNTVAVYGGEQGQYAGLTTLTLDAKNRVQNGENEMFMLGPAVTAQPAFADMVKRFEDEFNSQMAKAEKEQAARANGGIQADSVAHFIGNETCVRCHAAQGEQWKTTPHAHAWATLVDRHKDSTPECIGCHVIGYRKPGGYSTQETTPAMVNVGCENCHGMGSQHDTFSKGGKVAEAVCLTCHTSTTSPEFKFAQFKPYIDHTKKFAELPALHSAGMGAMK
jgi:2',3'-cyclic-nucleotide 2'-phosphodiesterase (5'-nucleotidase family)